MNLRSVVKLKEYVYQVDSPLGVLTMSGTENSLTGLWIEGQRFHASTLEPHVEEGYLPVFKETEQWLKLYFDGKKPDFVPALTPKGSEFRQAVWRLLLQIPYGQTTSYGAIAKHLAEEMGISRMSAQAVGGAVGHNPISIIIPCHRVIGSDGSLTGYGGGLDIKVRLLAIEGVQRASWSDRQK